MDESVQQIKSEFRRLVVEAFKEGLELLEPIILEKRWIGRHYNWPEMSFFSGCGLPCFHKSEFSGPTDYSKAFVDDSPNIIEDKLPSFKKLLLFSKSQKCIIGHLVPKESFYKSDIDTEFKERFLKIGVYSIPAELIDRYIHIYKTCNFSESLFQEVYKPYERFIFQEMLGIDIPLS